MASRRDGPASSGEEMRALVIVVVREGILMKLKMLRGRSDGRSNVRSEDTNSYKIERQAGCGDDEAKI